LRTVNQSGKRYLAVIPARGGSKRLPGKNLMELNGCSLLGRTISAAEGHASISEICVTTDDDEIVGEAKKFGPYVHFKRPAELATDSAKSFDVLLHAIDWFQEKGKFFDAVIFLQPTSPLRNAQHIREAIKLFESKEAKAVVSVCALEHPLEWCAPISENGGMESFGLSLDSQKRSQDLRQRYRLNGALYIYDISELKERGAFFYSEDTYAYEMGLAESVDVDTPDDFLLAKFWSTIK